LPPQNQPTQLANPAALHEGIDPSENVFDVGVVKAADQIGRSLLPFFGWAANALRQQRLARNTLLLKPHEQLQLVLLVPAGDEHMVLGVQVDSPRKFLGGLFLQSRVDARAGLLPE
jgi:hypothetical protein